MVKEVLNRFWKAICQDGCTGTLSLTYTHTPHSLSTNIRSDQQMMLTTVTPPVPVRIRGITLDYGLLRTVLERPKDASFDPWGEEEFMDLQPDGNSFDLMKGMIKTKR